MPQIAVLMRLTKGVWKMAEYGLKRLIIRTNWENLEWVIHSFVGINYPSLQKFGLDEDYDFATYVQNDAGKEGIAFLKRVLEKNTQTEGCPTFWHVNETFTHPNCSQSQGKFVIETYSKRVQLIISFNESSFWVDVRYNDPTLTHIHGYIKHIGNKNMKVWCRVTNPDGSERGLPLEDLPKMVRFWEGEGDAPLPKQYPFVGMGL
jgi:hypothetical protein